ncbi:MAG: sulfatase-like hydrolase/transferase [Phycisphaeraceae bacterium]
MNFRLMLACAVAFSALLQAQSTLAQDKPNVLLIISDDAGFADFGFQGSKKIPTPNFDQLASRGVAFSNAYAGSVCSPSRAMLTTGMYTARIGYSNNISSSGMVTKPITETPSVQGLPLSATTIWERMQSVGYSTACIGKWHLGAHTNGQRDGQTILGNVPQNQGVEHFLGIIAGSRSFWVGEASGTQALRHIASDGKGKVTADKVVEADYAGQYVTDTFGDMTVDVIRKQANADKPFFLYSSFTAPHNPMHATKEDIAAIAKLGHGFKKKREIQAAMQLALDRNIGKIMSALDDPNGDGDTADSIRDNTLVLFINDNGGDSHDSDPNYSSNYPLRHGKGSQWEGGIRVPMIVAGWGLDTKFQDEDVDFFDHPVHIIDLLPTSFAAGGGSFTKDDVIDGVNLLPYLNDVGKGEPHETLFLRRYSGFQHAVRQGDYKLIYRPADGYLLFDVVNDKGEKKNLSKEMPELVEELKRVMTDYDVLMDKPRHDNMALKTNPFYDFRFREGVDKSARWSEENIWIDADKPIQATMTPYDASPNTALVFRNRDINDYESINDLRRVGGQPFLANRLVFIHRDTPLKGKGTATIAGQPVLLAKDLKGKAPKLALFASREPAQTYTFDVRLDVHLYDNLQVLGNGNQNFVISGDLIEVREGLSLNKTGTSTLTLKGKNGLTGAINIKEGNVVARNGESLGKAEINIGQHGGLAIAAPLELDRSKQITVELSSRNNTQPSIIAHNEIVLDGTLHLDAMAITPVVGQRFVLVRAKEIKQSFDAIYGIRIDENYEFVVEQSKTELAVVVRRFQDYSQQIKRISSR